MPYQTQKFWVVMLIFLWIILLGGRSHSALAQAYHASSGKANLTSTSASNVQLLSHIGGTKGAVFVAGTAAYVGDGAAFIVLDITNPANPTLIGKSDPLTSTVTAIQVVNSIAYVAQGENGLRIVDVSDPTKPTEIGFYDTPGWANNLFVAGNLVYVADSDGGLRIIDVTDAAHPREVGAFPSSATATIRDVYVVGALAYVADLSSGLRILDVSNPATIKSVGFYDTPGYPTDVYVQGSTAYVSDWYNLRIVNVSNPANPTEIKVYNTIGRPYVSGTTAYIATGAGLQMLNVQNPFNPTPLGLYKTRGQANEVFVVNHLAFVADGDLGLQIVNVANPVTPDLVGVYTAPVWPQDIMVVSNTAYVADADAGLRIVDMANPANPSEKGAIATPDRAEGIYVTGNIAYVADSASGLRIIDVANPTRPTELGFYDTPGNAADVYVVGNTAYVADEGSGLRILNVKNFASPTEIGFYDTPDSAESVYVSGSTAYVADGASGLRILNISNPASPTEIGFYDTPGYAQKVVVVNHMAYVADGAGGLRILNVTNPASPTLVNFYDTPDYTNDVDVVGALAYLADSQSLRVLDISNPANPTEVAYYAGFADNASRLSITNHIVYITSGFGGLYVLRHPACYQLTVTHSGAGSDPAATPANSSDCPENQYLIGAAISLSAAPNTGWQVINWSGTVNDASSATSNTLTMPAANHAVRVNYRQRCYTLMLTHSGSGLDPTGTPPNSTICPNGQYVAGEAITFGAVPANGWQVVSWTGLANNASTTVTNTLSMPPNDMTVSVNYGEIPSAGPGDAYEQDNSCTRSRLIAADGSDAQEHTFHAVADVDWVRFNAAAGVTYRIEVQTPLTSTADVNLELYDQCDGTLKGEWKESFSPGARLDFKATANGPLYVRLADQDANVAGANTRYDVSVRALATANNNRALIILAGRLRGADTLQTNINHVAKDVYTVFQRNGYTSDNIYFLATDATLPGYTAAATRDSLHAAISTWAKGKLQNDGVLTLYLVDHGSPDLFYIDELSGQRLAPADLDGWLSELESAVPGVKINVIIEACESGSFISLPNSISKPGRVVITSSDATNDAKASKDGAYFSDHLLTWLRQGYNLAVGFGEARTVAKSIFALQQAQIDADGNSISNEASDVTVAASRSFAYAGTLGSDDWPPYIFSAQGPTNLTSFSGMIQADVRDNLGVREVWAVVYPPDYTPPPPSDVLQPETQPTILLSRVDNGNLWRGIYTGFTQAGVYRIVIQADDNEGLKARPFVIEVNAGSRIFLPLVRR